MLSCGNFGEWVGVVSDMTTSTSLLWAREEFGHARLGDARRTARAVALAAAVVERPSGKVTGVIQDSAGREGAFRLLSNDRVDVEALGHASHEATVKRCGNAPFVFVALDESSLSFTDRDNAKGLGRVGTVPSNRVRGMEAMTALAVDAKGCPLGVCGQKWWVRSDKLPPPYKKDKRPLEQRETVLWTSVMTQVRDTFRQSGSTTRPWFQMDRGGDAWHVLTKGCDEGHLLTIRACYDRRLHTGEPEQYLWATLQAQKPLAHVDLLLPPTTARRLKHHPKRPRHLAIRAAQVELRVTTWTKRIERVPVNVVYAHEKDPPVGCERLEWMLLTTYPVQSLQDALLVLQGYSQRWRVEDFHRTWKSGRCDIERSQLRSRYSIQRWATILAAVAARIERLKHLARTSPNQPALTEFSREELDAAILLSKTKRWKMGAELTIEQAVQLVAQLGGYTGKSSGGPPGSIVIGRGLDQITVGATVLAHTRSENGGLGQM
jgi:hypothetical protein